jgi:predicted nucleic acid-binding OB-fold protein
MSHTEKQKLEVANVMAKDFLSIQRGCTYKDLTDVERENLERIAVLARQIIDDPADYNPEDDISGLGC